MSERRKTQGCSDCLPSAVYTIETWDRWGCVQIGLDKFAVRRGRGRGQEECYPPNESGCETDKDEEHDKSVFRRLVSAWASHDMVVAQEVGRYASGSPVFREYQTSCLTNFNRSRCQNVRAITARTSAPPRPARSEIIYLNWPHSLHPLHCLP